MASIFRKLLRNQPASRIITTFNKSIPAPPFLNHVSETKSSVHRTIDPALPKTEDSNPNRSVYFYPSFPFGSFLNPIPSAGFVQSEAEDVVSGDLTTIWADSVKKKRKRKMNKHKLKKLRKRLRRKT